MKTKKEEKKIQDKLDIINNRTNILYNDFNFLDLGCGNGWVVKKFSNNNLCNLSVGVDGSKNMIKKAKNKDSKGKYYQSNIACISAAVLGNHVASSGKATMIAIKIICAITNGKTPL